MSISQDRFFFRALIVSTLLCIGLMSLFTTSVRHVYATTAYVPEPEYWAVLIGAAHYPAPVVELYGPDDDAVSFYGNLICWPNWRTDHIELLLSPNTGQVFQGIPAYEQPTNSNIFDALDWLKEKSSSDDIVLIYFAGHGNHVVDDNNPGEQDQCICTTDDPTIVISDDKFTEVLTNIRGTIVVVLDSCFSGGFAGRNGGTLAESPQDLAVEPSLKNRCVVLQATFSNEISQEWYAMIDDVPTGVGHGFFTYKLLEGVANRQADTNHDRRISAEEMFNYVPCPLRDPVEVPPPQIPLENPGMWDGDPAVEVPLFVPIVATNSQGMVKTKFSADENVFVRGTNLPPGEVNIEILRNSDQFVVWGPVAGEVDASGNLPTTYVWKADQTGHFDIMVTTGPVLLAWTYDSPLMAPISVYAPVGGYAYLIETHTPAQPLTPYLALIAIFAVGFTALRRKSYRRTK